MARKQSNTRSSRSTSKAVTSNNKRLSEESNYDNESKKLDGEKKVIKKRKYSRGGCNECRRRKIKCLEEKPECYNCTRLNKTCVYENKSRFKFSEVQPQDSTQDHSNNNHNNGNGERFENKDIQIVKRNDDLDQLSKTNSPMSVSNMTSPPVIHASHSPLDRYMQQADIKGNEVEHGYSSETTPILPPPRGSGIPEMSFPSMTSLAFPSIRANSPAPPLTVPKSSFRNNITDIVSPNESNSILQHGATGGADLINPELMKNKDMQNLFDEASLLVSDINHLVSVDLALQNHDLYTSDETMLRHHQRQIQPLTDSHNGNTPFMGITSDNASPTANSHKSSGSMSGSDTFERHNFQIDDFTDRINTHNQEDLNKSYNLQDQIVEEMKMSTSQLIEESIKHNNLIAPHITYLKTLLTTDLSYHLYPFASSVESNETVKLLLMYLKNCSYLLTSLLAILATFQFNKTGKKVHDLTRQKYISVCLRSLSDAFASNGASDRNSSHLINDIEKLLLTVLVLTSNFTASAHTQRDSILSSWKTHLRGAKDLLVNYSKISKSNDLNNQYMSGGLALAKIWFFAIESLAGLYTPLGGTLTKTKKNPSSSESSVKLIILTTDTEDDSENYNNIIFLDTGHFNPQSNPEYHDSLVHIGLQTSYPTQNLHLNAMFPDKKLVLDEFNLFVGYCMSYVYLIQELTNCLESLRNNPGKQLSNSRITKLMALVHDARQSQVAPQFKRKSYIIPRTSPAHPDYRLTLTKIVLPPAAYSKFNDPDGHTLYYSWFDFSHQLHVDSINLRILVTPGLLQLPHKHPLVKELVRDIVESAFFIKSKDEYKDMYNELKQQGKILTESTNFFLPTTLFDIRCIMTQSPFRICAGLVERDIDFEKIELFFLGLVKLGNGSSLAALDKVAHFKEKAKHRKERGLEDSSEEGEEAVKDIIGDMDAIPFA